MNVALLQLMPVAIAGGFLFGAAVVLYGPELRLAAAALVVGIALVAAGGVRLLADPVAVAWDDLDAENFAGPRPAPIHHESGRTT